MLKKDKKQKGLQKENYKTGVKRCRSLSVHAQSKMPLNMVLMERKACCHVANAFLSGLELIWLISLLEISEIFKKLQESMGEANPEFATFWCSFLFILFSLEVSK